MVWYTWYNALAAIIRLAYSGSKSLNTTTPSTLTWPHTYLWCMWKSDKPTVHNIPNKNMWWVPRVRKIWSPIPIEIKRLLSHSIGDGRVQISHISATKIHRKLSNKAPNRKINQTFFQALMDRGLLSVPVQAQGSRHASQLGILDVCVIIGMKEKNKALSSKRERCKAYVVYLKWCTAHSDGRRRFIGVSMDSSLARRLKRVCPGNDIWIKSGYIYIYTYDFYLILSSDIL